MTRELKVYRAALAYAEMFRRAGLNDLTEITAQASAMGSLEQVRERIAEYHSAGATTVALVPMTAEDPGGKRRLAAIGGDAR